MTKYLIKTHDGVVHTINAATYVQDSLGLRFVGDAGATQGLFPFFEWMKVSEEEEHSTDDQAAPQTDEAGTASPELAGE
ncbi:hypothetical protein [Pseudomonas sp. TMB3-21]